MSKLLYSAIMSLDGFIEDEGGDFSWAMPGDEAHAFINDLVRSIGTYLYGRRLYEVMTVWETDASLGAQSPILADFSRIWRAADKVVYSRTLASAPTTKTRIEREFHPGAVRRMKDETERDIVIGGPELAASAFRAGLVDECHLFLAPTVVGSGKHAFPSDLHLELELRQQRSFAGGMVYLQYHTVG